jgi:hypothetical protein
MIRFETSLEMLVYHYTFGPTTRHPPVQMST